METTRKEGIHGSRLDFLLLKNPFSTTPTITLGRTFFPENGRVGTELRLLPRTMSSSGTRGKRNYRQYYGNKGYFDPSTLGSQI